jgi:asparagine synthase (glutamine-hydrolysing)
MCGIAGAFDLTERRDFSRERLLAMTGAIAHRGPDDEHVYQEPGVALGARRLSIVDLEGGRQPLSNEDGSIWVAFNGELFEYPELRTELLARGHQLATRCDTESWVHLYEDHREGMFEKARGQFAVSLWDRRNRTLILGRDRTGICPCITPSATVAPLGLGDQGPPVERPRSRRARPGRDRPFLLILLRRDDPDMLLGGEIPASGALPEGPGRPDLDPPVLGPGLSRRRRRASHGRYRAPSRRAGAPAPPVGRASAPGDVPVVSYISGGLDSTVVLGLSSRQRGKAVPSFTIGFDKAGPDERAESAEAAGILGSPLTTVTMDKSRVANAFPELIVAAEGPVMDTSCAALMRLSGAVHDKVTKSC